MNMFYNQNDRVVVGEAAIPPLYGGRVGTVISIIKASGGWIYETELDGEENPPIRLLLMAEEINGHAPKIRKPRWRYNDDDNGAVGLPFE